MTCALRFPLEQQFVVFACRVVTTAADAVSDGLRNVISVSTAPWSGNGLGKRLVSSSPVVASGDPLGSMKPVSLLQSTASSSLFLEDIEESLTRCQVAPCVNALSNP